MTNRHVKAAPVDETEAAMGFVLEHDSADGTPHITEVQTHDSYTTPSA